MAGGISRLEHSLRWICCCSDICDDCYVSETLTICAPHCTDHFVICRVQRVVHYYQWTACQLGQNIECHHRCLAPCLNGIGTRDGIGHGSIGNLLSQLRVFRLPNPRTFSVAGITQVEYRLYVILSLDTMLDAITAVDI